MLLAKDLTAKENLGLTPLQNAKKWETKSRLLTEKTNIKRVETAGKLPKTQRSSFCNNLPIKTPIPRLQKPKQKAEIQVWEDSPVKVELVKEEPEIVVEYMAPSSYHLHEKYVPEFEIDLEPFCFGPPVLTTATKTDFEAYNRAKNFKIELIDNLGDCNPIFNEVIEESILPKVSVMHKLPKAKKSGLKKSLVNSQGPPETGKFIKRFPKKLLSTSKPSRLTINVIDEDPFPSFASIDDEISLAASMIIPV